MAFLPVSVGVGVGRKWFQAAFKHPSPPSAHSSELVLWQWPASGGELSPVPCPGPCHFLYTFQVCVWYPVGQLSTHLVPGAEAGVKTLRPFSLETDALSQGRWSLGLGNGEERMYYSGGGHLLADGFG